MGEGANSRNGNSYEDSADRPAVEKLAAIAISDPSFKERARLVVQCFRKNFFKHSTARQLSLYFKLILVACGDRFNAVRQMLDYHLKSGNK
jgi:hypothetical protein